MKTPCEVQSIEDLIEDFCSVDYSSYIVYSDCWQYDSEYCDKECGKYICRCKRIINPVAYRPWFDQLEYGMGKHLSSITYNIFQEILSKEDFIFEVNCGYYGDEIDYVKLNEDAKEKFLLKIELLTPYL